MISIFARPTYIGNRFPRHTKESAAQRLSSRIRGEEMAAYLGAKLNPTKGYENDVCIHVKHFGAQVKDGHWFDFLDGQNNLELVKKRPGVNVIAASQNSYETLKEAIPNRLELIPQHHINTDRLRNKEHDVLTAGYVGSPSPTAFRLYEQIGKALSVVGIPFVSCFDFKSRQDAIDLYQQIDLFVIGPWPDNNPHKIPTKLINAASFGVPTIAYPLPGYKELEGKYVRADDVDELVKEAEKFKDSSYRQEWVERAVEMSEPYHISHIAKLYQELT